MGGIAPAEGDLTVLQGDQSAIGYGYAMRASAGIAEHVFRAAEWGLARQFRTQRNQPSGVFRANDVPGTIARTGTDLWRERRQSSIAYDSFGDAWRERVRSASNRRVSV
jgi:hypothetical protein